MKLFVAGLPLDMDEEELNAIFADYGPVTSAMIICDRVTHQSRGFGFVEFKESSDAQEAIKALHGGEIEGKPITVKLAEDRTPGTARPSRDRHPRPRN